MEQTLTFKLKLYKPTLAKQKMYQEMAGRCTAFANLYLQLERKDRLAALETELREAPPGADDAVVAALLAERDRLGYLVGCARRAGVSALPPEGRGYLKKGKVTQLSFLKILTAKEWYQTWKP